VVAEARRRFARGNRLYTQGSYSEALLAYQAALDLYPEPTILYNIGQTYEKLRDPGRAALYLERYLKARPRSTERAAVEARIAKLKETARVEVTVTSYPPGAAIFVGDGRGAVRGRTPFQLPLPLGRQRVVLELAGFVPATREVDVKLGETNLVDAQLERRSSISVDADVPGALARIRVLASRTPLREDRIGAGKRIVASHRLPHLFEVDPGRHRLEVELAGYQRVERSVEVRPGEQLSLLLNLKALPRYGRLQIASVRGATVLVDGRALASLPMAPAKLATGSYRVSVEREGYRPWESKITISEGRLTVARVSLSATRGVGTKTVLYGAAGLGAGALIAGAVLGALALRAERDYNTLPERSKLDDGKTKALLSDVCFATAGAAALAAVITYLATERGPSSAELDVSERP
jgi:tetratricopeptide (TPR) repeat protein